MSSLPVLALLMAGTLVAPHAAPAAPGSGDRWSWPVGTAGRPAVLAPFDAPDERWGAGHRGIDLDAAVGERVRAVDDGTVTHRGRIAGRGTVSITHPSGVRSTYEPVDSSLRVGDHVEQGEVIGRLGDEPGHCAPAACLHLGARRGATYLDPMPFFGARRVILLPVP